MSNLKSLKFETIITLRTPEEVEELRDAITRVILLSGDLFQTIQSQPDCWKPFMRDIITIERLTQVFATLAQSATQKPQEIVHNISNSKIALGKLFLSLNGSGYVNVQLQKDIVTEIQNVLLSIGDISDEMEDFSILHNLMAAKRAFQFLLMLKETTSDFHLKGKVDDTRAAVTQFVTNLNNRCTALKDCQLKDDLLYHSASVAQELEPYLNATFRYLNGEYNALHDQTASLTTLVFAIKAIMDALELSRTKPVCEFQYEEILDKLEGLTDAVAQGSAAAAADSARMLVAEINKLKERQQGDSNLDDLLSDSCNKLGDMTKRLLEATKNALNNPEDSDSLKTAVEGNIKICFFF
jgi:hypothetical protein